MDEQETLDITPTIDDRVRDELKKYLDNHPLVLKDGVQFFGPSIIVIRRDYRIPDPKTCPLTSSWLNSGGPNPDCNVSMQQQASTMAAMADLGNGIPMICVAEGTIDIKYKQAIVTIPLAQPDSLDIAFAAIDWMMEYPSMEGFMQSAIFENE